MRIYGERTMGKGIGSEDDKRKVSATAIHQNRRIFSLPVSWVERSPAPVHCERFCLTVLPGDPRGALQRGCARPLQHGSPVSSQPFPRDSLDGSCFLCRLTWGGHTGLATEANLNPTTSTTTHTHAPIFFAP